MVYKDHPTPKFDGCVTECLVYRLRRRASALLRSYSHLSVCGLARHGLTTEPFCTTSFGRTHLLCGSVWRSREMSGRASSRREEMIFEDTTRESPAQDPSRRTFGQPVHRHLLTVLLTSETRIIDSSWTGQVEGNDSKATISLSMSRCWRRMCWQFLMRNYGLRGSCAGVNGKVSNFIIACPSSVCTLGLQHWSIFE